MRKLGTDAAAISIILLFSILQGCTDPRPPPNPDSQIALGWQQYRGGDYKLAVKAFESALQSPENSEAHLRAIYGLATVWNLRTPDADPAKAASLYGQIIESNPKHDLAAWSMLALARMKHLAPVGTEPDYVQVRKAYRDCIDRFPTHLASEEAFIYLQSTYVASLRPDDARKAIEALTAFVRTQPHAVFLSSAYMLLAESYQVLDQTDASLAARIEALESAEVDPANPEQDQASDYWKIAVTAEFDSGDFKTARKYYRGLIDEYPNDLRVYGAKLALKRMDSLETKIEAQLRQEMPRDNTGFRAVSGGSK